MTQTSKNQGPTKADIAKAIEKLTAELAQLGAALNALPDGDIAVPMTEPTAINHARAAELGMTPNLAVRMDLYLAALDRAAAVHFKQNGYNWEPTTHTAEAGNAGRKFIRVVSTDQGGSRSVHAFVEKTTGKVVKAAGWAAPAKSMAAATKGQLLSKYTLADDDSFDALLALLEAQPHQIHGSYTYGAVA